MKDVLVLCYHALSASWDADLAVSPDAFERQLEHMVERGYRGTTFTDAITGKPRDKVFAVTFDDGYRSVLELAFPVMSRLDVPGTVFVPTDWIDRDEPMCWPGIDHWLDGRHADELRGLSWQELGTLVAAGWEIGSHTRSHPHLTEVGDDRLAAELRESRRTLERRLGHCRSIAYPYGDVDHRVAKAAGAAGYEAGAALPDRYKRTGDRLRWPRVSVMREDSLPRFRRQVTRYMRALQGSPTWGLLAFSLRATKRAIAGFRRAIGERFEDGVLPAGASPGLRLAAEAGRIIRFRPAAVMLALAGRAGLLHAYTIWPRAAAPLYVVGAGDVTAARWMRSTLEPEAPDRRFPGPATWNALRTRALLIPATSRLAVEAAERALGRPLADPRRAIFSPTGANLSKATCFVFEEGGDEPMLVVKMMPERAETRRLQRETELVEVLRELVSDSPEVADALPLRPLWSDHLHGEYLVVQPVDPLAAFTAAEGRSVSLRWLGRFQRATATHLEEWGEPDEEWCRDVIAYAWERAFPDARAAVLAAFDSLTAPLRGLPVPRCAVHGDFWRGNVATDGERLRIFDWEWAQVDGRPFFDLWTYELGDLRDRAEEGETEFRDSLAEALARVESQLEMLEIDPRFAIPTLAPAVAHLTFRFRRATGSPGGGERSSKLVMASAQELVTSAAGTAAQPVGRL